MNRLRDLPEYRYRTDATFHTLVDSLEALLIHAHLTPSEIREAAMLAAIHHEERSRRREDFVKRDRAQTALEVLETDAANQARERENDNRTGQEINERREELNHDRT